MRCVSLLTENLLVSFELVDGVTRDAGALQPALVIRLLESNGAKVLGRFLFPPLKDGWHFESDEIFLEHCASIRGPPSPSPSPLPNEDK